MSKDEQRARYERFRDTNDTTSAIMDEIAKCLVRGADAVAVCVCGHLAEDHDGDPARCLRPRCPCLTFEDELEVMEANNRTLAAIGRWRAKDCKGYI